MLALLIWGDPARLSSAFGEEIGEEPNGLLALLFAPWGPLGGPEDELKAFPASDEPQRELLLLDPAPAFRPAVEEDAGAPPQGELEEEDLVAETPGFNIEESHGELEAPGAPSPLFWELVPKEAPIIPNPFFEAGMFMFPKAGFVGSRREKSTPASGKGEDDFFEKDPLAEGVTVLAGEKELDESLLKASFRLFIAAAVSALRGDQLFSFTDWCFRLFFKALLASGLEVCCLAKPPPGDDGMPIDFNKSGIANLLFSPPKLENKSVKNRCGLQGSSSFDKVCFPIFPDLCIDPEVRVPIKLAFPSLRVGDQVASFGDVIETFCLPGNDGLLIWGDQAPPNGELEPFGDVDEAPKGEFD